MWRSDVDTKKGSFIIELRGDFTGFLRGYDVRMDADQFHTFQSRPHVNRIYFVKLVDWGDALFGIAVRRKGTWHYEYDPGAKYNLDTQEKDITFDLITYLDKPIGWLKRLPTLYTVERTTNQFQSNRYPFVCFPECFRPTLFSRIVDDFRQAEPGSEIWHYPTSDEAVPISDFDIGNLMRVKGHDYLLFTEFEVRSTTPVSKRNYYRLCALLNQVGWIDSRDDFQRYCDTHPGNLFWDKRR
jgi:hypothetical protein